MFSLEFDNLFSIIVFESFESKENETLTEINNASNTTSTANERPALPEEFHALVIGLRVVQFRGNRAQFQIGLALRARPI